MSDKENSKKVETITSPTISPQCTTSTDSPSTKRNAQRRRRRRPVVSFQGESKKVGSKETDHEPNARADDDEDQQPSPKKSTAVTPSATTTAIATKTTTSSTPASPTLTLTQAKDAIAGVLAEFAKVDIAHTLANAQAEAAGKLDRIMELVVPLLFEIQGHVMTRYGFIPNDDGFDAWSQALKQHENNIDFKTLSDRLKAHMAELTRVGGAASGSGSVTKQSQSKGKQPQKAKSESKKQSSQGRQGRSGRTRKQAHTHDEDEDDAGDLDHKNSVESANNDEFGSTTPWTVPTTDPSSGPSSS